jgi:hypothetical protein
MKKILSANWHIREGGINEIELELRQGNSSQVCGEIDREKVYLSTWGIVALSISDKIA